MNTAPLCDSLRSSQPNIRPSSASRTRAQSYRDHTMKPNIRPSSATYSYRGDPAGYQKTSQKKKPHSRPASAHARVGGGGDLRRPMSGNSIKTSSSSNLDLASSIAQKLGIEDDEQPLRSKKTTIRVQAQQQGPQGMSTTKKVKMKSSKQGKSNLSRFNMFKAKGTPIAPYDPSPKHGRKKASSSTPDVVVIL